ncbi:hypothetical protein HYPSUDRAFT_45132 [Hypholoma sublateritium FD-334 SS-4]|uniref:Uncharacterized protein n=1 Tax=Hypholoma sublateritium (strain FD-334 SS-4) TaxID=945553 RepID=A0A0D2KVA1_HYPSF|nr:hypothetical protein HYPSUDRAFT_45132 [Hypholoma sublateritium FD-334 SS-4]
MPFPPFRRQRKKEANPLTFGCPNPFNIFCPKTQSTTNTKAADPTTAPARTTSVAPPVTPSSTAAPTPSQPNTNTFTVQPVTPPTATPNTPSSQPQSTPAASPTSRSISATAQLTSAAANTGDTSGGSTGSTTATTGSPSGTPKGNDVDASQTTATFITTESNGQTQTQEITIGSNAQPFTTTNGFVFITTTDSVGQVITVSYGLDPAQTSTASSANSAANGTAANSTGATASGSSHAGAIAGGVVAALAVVCLVIALSFFLRRRRRALRTAPSSEFIVQRQYPFTGSAQFQFQRAGSFSSPGGSVVDIRQQEGGALLTREQSPRTYNVAGEKMVLV